MKKSYKFLIGLVLILVVGISVYFYFSNKSKSEIELGIAVDSALSADPNSPLSSSLDSSVQANLISSDDRIASDIAFISTLAALNNINIDTTLFSSPIFNALKDNTVKLDPVVSGRLNPFAPINTGGLDSYSSIVTTNTPVEVKSTSVVLSGTINDPNIKEDGYFEYGTTKELGKKTSSVTVSLIGVFVSNIVGLDSKTTYFYRACSKINGTTFCGDIVSFETN